MAKYTTTVKSICEEKSGMGNVGLGKVDQVIQAACGSIFTSRVTLFDPEYKEALLRKILKHYYMREIGLETVGLWCLKMNTKLEEIAPYYTYLYQNGLKDLNPYMDTDLTTDYTGDDNRDISLTHTGSGSTDRGGTDSRNHTSESTENRHSESGNTESTTGNHDITKSDEHNATVKESDTPQGGITGLADDKYLTRASMTDEGGSGTEHDSTSGHREVSGTDDGQTTVNEGGDEHSEYESHESSNDTFTDVTNDGLNRKFIQKVSGRSGKSPIEVFKMIRESFYNIDMLVIEEFNELFMGIY